MCRYREIVDICNIDCNHLCAFRLALQDDNNVVLFDGQNNELWSTNTTLSGTDQVSLPTYLSIPNYDGIFYLYDAAGNVLWSSGSPKA